MSTIGNTYATMLDVAKRQSPDGKIAPVIEVLAASNPIMADANVIEGNLDTGNKVVQRTSEPTGTWRKLNYGVLPEKSTTEPITDFCGILEAYSQVDVALANLGGNAAAFRASEDMAFVAGMTSTAATAVFYGNQGTDPEQPHGLAPRYNSLTTGYTTQTITASGSGSDNTSIWIVTWGPKTCSLIYPKGGSAGLTTQDMGEQIIVDVSGATARKYTAYVTKFVWNLGLSLMDYRYVIRICNIDVSDLTNDAATGADLLDKMVDAYYARPTIELGNTAKTFIYCNKTIAKYLHKQAQNKANVNLTLDYPAGKPIVNFIGAQVRVCDNIVSTETAVS